MKKYINFSIVLLLLTISFGVYKVKADFYTCATSEITCEFDSTKSNQVCKNSSGKKVSIQNYDTNVTDMFGVITNYYQAVKTLNTEKRCPKYFIYSPKGRSLFFIDSDTYKFNDNGVDETWSKEKLVEWMQTAYQNSRADFYLEASLLLKHESDESCDAKLTEAKNSMDKAKSTIISNDCNTIYQDVCKKYLDDYYKAIQTGKDYYEKFKNSECNMKVYKGILDTHEKDYEQIKKEYEKAKKEYDKKNTTTPTTTSSSTGNGEEENCPLGEDVTADLYGLLKIFRILAPLLVIVLSSYDAVMSLTKGDIQADMKRIVNRFKKRLIYAIILFFLPVLVDQFMQMANVWGEGGTCKLTGSGSNSSTPTKEKCPMYGDQKSCDADKRCYWDIDSSSCYTLNGGESENTTTTTTSKPKQCSDYTVQRDCSNQSKCYWDAEADACYSLK